MNNIKHELEQQTTCKFKRAKCSWNVIKLNSSQNVWGWKRTIFLLVDRKMGFVGLPKTQKNYKKLVEIDWF
jgi:hypothetical protein